MTARTHILTVDVEDWFHILESDAAPERARWDELESRVERNTERLLELFADFGASATFFVVGWVAWRHPQLVRRIAAAGHEIASHSFWHEVIRRHDLASFRADLRASKQLLEDLSGKKVEGFRAAGNSITRSESWAFDVLVESGFTYDASVCPGTSSHGGFPSAPLAPHQLLCRAGSLIEIPSSTVGAGPWRRPYAGGGYLRLLPYSLVKAGIALEEGAGRPANLYVHPREIDPGQPRMRLPLKRRFKYYVGLRGLEAKLERLLSEYRFIGVRQWIRECRPEILGRVLDLRGHALVEPAPDPALIPPLPPGLAGSQA
jgi:polysaccharide deacetylase family protein (PEP-CTERM system associated)